MTETLFDPQKRHRGPPHGRASTGLPLDLQVEAVRRLRIMTLVFSMVFLFANFAATALHGNWAFLFGRLQGWLPGTLSISIALLVWAVASSPRLAPLTVMKIGLVWEVVGCYGIAFAENWGVIRGIQYVPGRTAGYGLSWVAVFALFFTIVVPSPPRRAALAAAFGLSSVPVVFTLSMRFGGTEPLPSADKFFFALVFPYLLVLLTTAIGARVVYKLGTDVRRAREMGSYRLVERMGHGGMGEVWRATHRMLARPAAIKIIRGDFLSAGGDFSQAVRRFEAEAQATASLSSPHTVQLYDYGATPDGTFYYVMELLQGMDLENLVGHFGPMPVPRIIAVLQQVCESLREAHAKGLVHRDIKPANIYLSRIGDRCDFVKVLDFGLVKRDRSQATLDTRLTGAGVVGTPAYLPPEMGHGGEVDHRADLYAVGCVGYWLASGRLVFEGRSAMDVASKHLLEKPEPPSARSEMRIPAEFDAVILACLEKEPDRRPRDARRLADLLREVPVEAPWTDAHAEAWWNAHLPDAVAHAGGPPGPPLSQVATLERM
jgi:eukaryotic-like serine/threonine-protein kinase